MKKILFYSVCIPSLLLCTSQVYSTPAELPLEENQNTIPSEIAPKKPISLIILERKASTGDPEAQFETGIFYFKGIDYPKDIPKAIHYLTLASEKKHPKALYNLASLYLDGSLVQQNTAKGISLLEEAIAEGYAPAQVAYSFLYLDGKLVSQDIEKSYKYLCIAGNNKNITESERKEIDTYKKNVGARLTPQQVLDIEKQVAETVYKK